jgi:hypothetical protein
MKEMNISINGQSFQDAYRIFDEDRMADEVRKHFGA